MAQFLPILLATIIQALRRFWQKVPVAPLRPMPVRVPTGALARPPLSHLRFEPALLLSIAEARRR